VLQLYNCKLVNYEGGLYPTDIGDMWYGLKNDIHDNGAGSFATNGYRLSNQYVKDWMDKRLPIFVNFPGVVGFCIDSAQSGSSDGWAVTGEAPAISCVPSISLVGIYHTILTNGVFS
jgi:hypothetical protein